MRRELPTALLVCALVGSSLPMSGCATLGAPGGGLGFGAPVQRDASAILDPRFDLEVTRPSSATEREAVLAANSRDTGSDDEKKKVTPALFWTGIILGSIGAVGLVGGGVTGAVTEAQIRDGDAEGWSREDRKAKIQQGEVANTITIVGAVLTIVGYGVATVVAGIDYSRCGPVVTKKRREACETGTP